MDVHEAAIQEALELIGEIPAIQPLLNVICRKTGLGFAAVAIVTDTKWVAAAVQDDVGFGLEAGGELQLDTTICNEIRQHRQPVVIDHVDEDPLYCQHHTPRMYGLQSYISMPIHLKNGDFFGTLCAIDPSPHVVSTPETIAMFELYADLIAFYLQSATQVKEAEARLLTSQKDNEMRDLFLAVLGHDLRNPLTATINAGKMIQQLATDQIISKMARIVQSSSYRMRNLVDNVMKYSRSKVNGGWEADIKEQPEISKKIELTINELQLSWHKRTIDTNLTLDAPVHCDDDLICQVASNLITNALTYGCPESAVKVSASCLDGDFVLNVTNNGPAIPAAVLHDIFKPFSQLPGNDERRNGLGLGLHIVAEVARLHNGYVEVNSTAAETTFTFCIPRLEVGHTAEPLVKMA